MNAEAHRGHAEARGGTNRKSRLRAEKRSVRCPLRTSARPLCASAIWFCGTLTSNSSRLTHTVRVVVGFVGNNRRRRGHDALLQPRVLATQNLLRQTIVGRVVPSVERGKGAPDAKTGFPAEHIRQSLGFHL